MFHCKFRGGGACWSFGVELDSGRSLSIIAGTATRGFAATPKIPEREGRQPFFLWSSDIQKIFLNNKGLPPRDNPDVPPAFWEDAHLPLALVAFDDGIPDWDNKSKGPSPKECIYLLARDVAAVQFLATCLPNRAILERYVQKRLHTLNTVEGRGVPRARWHLFYTARVNQQGGGGRSSKTMLYWVREPRLRYDRRELKGVVRTAMAKEKGVADLPYVRAVAEGGEALPAGAAVECVPPLPDSASPLFVHQGDEEDARVLGFMRESLNLCQARDS